MSVAVAVSASTGNAYLCGKHLGPAIGSHPPNVKGGMLWWCSDWVRPHLWAHSCYWAEATAALQGMLPPTPLLGVMSSPSLSCKRFLPPTGAACASTPFWCPVLGSCLVVLGWWRAAVPTLTPSHPNNGTCYIPYTSKHRLSGCSVLTQASSRLMRLSRAPSQWLWPGPLVEQSVPPLSSNFLVFENRNLPREDCCISKYNSKL